MLMPAAVLIVVMLGAIAVDRAVVFGAQRDLVASAQAAADNGASLGVDLDRLRADGEIEPDLAAIEQAIALAATTFEPGTTVTWYLQETTWWWAGANRGSCSLRCPACAHRALRAGPPSACRSLSVWSGRVVRLRWSDRIQSTSTQRVPV
jgi:hypothetical protein